MVKVMVVYQYDGRVTGWLSHVPVLPGTLVVTSHTIILDTQMLMNDMFLVSSSHFASIQLLLDDIWSFRIFVLLDFIFNSSILTKKLD